MPFGIWTRVDPRKHVLVGGTHCRHLANTTEPFMCGGDAACCQITTTTFIFLLFSVKLFCLFVCRKLEKFACFARASVVTAFFLVLSTDLYVSVSSEVSKRSSKSRFGISNLCLFTRPIRSSEVDVLL